MSVTIHCVRKGRAWFARSSKPHMNHVLKEFERIDETCDIVFINGVFSIYNVNLLKHRFPGYKFVCNITGTHVWSAVLAACVIMMSCGVVTVAVRAMQMNTWTTVLCDASFITITLAYTHHLVIIQRCVPHCAHGLVTAIRIPEEGEQLCGECVMVSGTFSATALDNCGYMYVNATPWVGNTEYASSLHVQYDHHTRRRAVQAAEVSALVRSMTARGMCTPRLVCAGMYEGDEIVDI